LSVEHPVPERQRKPAQGKLSFRAPPWEITRSEPGALKGQGKHRGVIRSSWVCVTIDSIAPPGSAVNDFDSRPKITKPPPLRRWSNGYCPRVSRRIMALTPVSWCKGPQATSAGEMGLRFVSICLKNFLQGVAPAGQDCFLYFHARTTLGRRACQGRASFAPLGHGFPFVTIHSFLH